MEGERFIDPLDFLRALDSSEIRYLLIDRQAMVLLGAPVVTADYDFYLSPDPEDLRELLRLAKEKELELSTRSPASKPFFSLLSDNLKLDFFRSRSYLTQDGERFTFEEVYARKKQIPVRDFVVQVPAIEDLIRIKKTRNFPRDKEDINYLQVLLEKERGLS